MHDVHPLPGVRLGLLWLALLCAACGPPKDATPTTRCNGEVTGAVNGTWTTCDTFDQLYRVNTDTFVLSASYQERTVGLNYAVGANLEVAGGPTGTHSVCTLTTTLGERSWKATTDGTISIGTCTMTVTEAVPFEKLGNTNTVTYCILRANITGLLENPNAIGTDQVNLTWSIDHAPAAKDQDRQRALCKR